MTPQAALAEAKKRAGSVPNLAKMVKVSKQALYKWDIVPVEQVRRVSEVTGIPDYVLRPDHFLNPARAKARTNGRQRVAA